MKDTVYPYVIVNAAGAIVCQAPAACRYSRHIEKSLQDSGHAIILNGKRITKREVNENGNE